MPRYYWDIFYPGDCAFLDGGSMITKIKKDIAGLYTLSDLNDIRDYSDNNELEETITRLITRLNKYPHARMRVYIHDKDLNS